MSRFAHSYANLCFTLLIAFRRSIYRSKVVRRLVIYVRTPWNILMTRAAAEANERGRGSIHSTIYGEYIVHAVRLVCEKQIRFTSLMTSFVCKRYLLSDPFFLLHFCLRCRQESSLLLFYQIMFILK